MDHPEADLLPEATKLMDALVSGEKTMVDLDDVLRLWSAAAPHLASSPDKMARLSDALEDLSTVGVLRLPAAASWDRSSRPPLPRFVRVVREKAVRDRPWRGFPWRAELGWVASAASLSSRQYEQLVAINSFLSSPDRRIVPARLRSAQVLGDEKALDDLSNSSLWGDGKLSWGLLACERIAPPLASCRVGRGPDVLVLENADPYWALEPVLKELDTSIGILAWGAGRGVEQSVLSLWRAGSPGRVFYVGDLDPAGVGIAVNAARNVAAAGFELLPHVGLWEAMARLEPTGVGEHDWSRCTGQEWLGCSWGVASPVRTQSGRVAQERLDLSTLAEAVVEPMCRDCACPHR